MSTKARAVSPATTTPATGARVTRATSTATRDWRKLTARGLLYLILLVGGLAMVFPFLWMVVSSLKHARDVYDLALLPRDPTLENYRQVFQRTQFVRWFGNSLIVAAITTASVAFFDSLAGYTLAKFRFPGRQVIFIMILSTLMVPTEMLVIPWYLMSINLHWSNGYWGIMFPGVMSAFGVFLMRQFFDGVPNDLLDAGRIDGISEFGLFWRVALPLVRPALAALCIFTFLGNWNAFLWPLIVTRTAEMRTLPVGIAFFSSEAGSAYELIMTAASLATIPVLVVFTLFQRQIIKGVALTGLK